jgi:undecaprenyl diphosphate synthase
MHVGIIPDGNGRWATSKGLLRHEGHMRGAEVIKEIAIACLEHEDIKQVTFYAFSIQNWKREHKELYYIMCLMLSFMENMKSIVNNYDCKFQFVGNIQHLPENLQEMIYYIEKKTENSKGKIISICFSYGGREDILVFFKNVKKDIKTLTTKEISEMLRLPDIDLVIRTSGEYRISNFMLWQSAYAEYYFTKTLWPDFTSSELNKAIQEFKTRDRRYGAVKEENYCKIPPVEEKYILIKELFSEYNNLIDHSQLYEKLLAEGYTINEQPTEEKYTTIEKYFIVSDDAFVIWKDIQNAIDNMPDELRNHNLRLLYTDFSVEVIDIFLESRSAILFNKTTQMEKELLERYYECEYLRRTSKEDKEIYGFLSNYYFFKLALQDKFSDDMVFLASILITSINEYIMKNNTSYNASHIISNVIKDILELNEKSKKLVFIGLSVLMNMKNTSISIPSSCFSWISYVIV